MNQRIRILDRKLYREKYDLAYANLISRNSQIALNIFLELRQLGFTDFELLESISECYRDLNKPEEVEKIIQLMKAKYGNQKKEEIKKIEHKPRRRIYINLDSPKWVLNNENLHLSKKFFEYSINQWRDLWQLSDKDLYKYWEANLQLGNLQLSLLICQHLARRNQSTCEEQLLTNYLNCNYLKTIELFQFVTDPVYKNNQNAIIGLCYYQMKQYQKALYFLKKQQHSIKGDIFSYYLIINSLQLNVEYNQVLEFYQLPQHETVEVIYLQMYILQNLLLKYKFDDPIRQDVFWGSTQQQLNQGYILNSHFIFINNQTKQKSDKNIQLQQQMIDLMLKYNPQLAEGHFDQYLCKKSMNLIINQNEVIDKLSQCFDSVFKFKSLAHIFFECQRFEEALINVQKAKEWNPYDSDVLKQEWNIYLEMKNYPKAKQVEKQMIILEQENSHFVLLQVRHYIKQYQFHQALGLLNMIEGNEIILVHRILLQLLNYQYLDIETKSLLIENIECLSPTHHTLFQGHVSLLQKNIELAKNAYEQIYSNRQKNRMIGLMVNKMKQVWKFYKNLYYQIGIFLKLNEQEFYQMSFNDCLEQIMRISAYKYYKIVDNHRYSRNRFKESLLSLFVSLIYQKLNAKVCQWIESNKSFTLPYMSNLFEQIIEILYTLYNINHQTKEKYLHSLNREFEKFQSQFPSFVQCIQELQKFLECQEFENHMNLLLNDQLINELENEGVQIFKEPYFYDPYSKKALNFLIKVFGFHVAFEDFVSGYYDNHTQLWRYLLTSGKSEEYYKAMIRFNQNKRK